MAWTKNGTVGATNGSKNIVGTGTTFVQSKVQAGDAISINSTSWAEIEAVSADGALTLVDAWLGSTASGLAYKIMPTNSRIGELAAAVSEQNEDVDEMLEGPGAGKFADGSAAAPGMRFANDLDTGLHRPGTNVVAVGTAGAERMRVDAGGNVGIGVLNPGARHHVKSSGEVSRLETGAARGTNFSLYSTYYDPTGRKGFFGYGGSTDDFVISNEIGAFAVSTNGSERMRISDVGNVGIGTTVPGYKLHVGGTIASTEAGVIGVMQASSGLGAVYLGTFSNHSLAFTTNSLERMRLTPDGNLLVGTMAATNSAHTFSKASSEGFGLAAFQSLTTGKMSVVMLSVNAEGWNASGAAMWVGRHTSTLRSINAAGTINTSGADYAEYMLKSDGCGPIAKGDVCGVDADGRLTKSWAAAISFVIKSTDPAYVGGDNWSAHLQPRPQAPAAVGPAPGAPVAPDPFSAPAPEREGGESDEAYAARLAQWTALRDGHDAAVAAYDVAVIAHAAALDQWAEDQAAFDAAQAQYEIDLPAWETDLEAARQTVDRIAFAGQVPANVTGDFAVGDYIIAVANGGGIKAVAVAEADITFDQYRKRIGKVWAVREGRAWIDVQHG